MDRKNVKTIEKVLTKATCSHGILQIPIGGPDDSDKDGSLYQEEMTITPVSFQRGDITHFVAIEQDITDASRPRTPPRDRAFFRSAELAPDGLMMADADGMAAGIARDGAPLARPDGRHFNLWSRTHTVLAHRLLCLLSRLSWVRFPPVLDVPFDRGG